MHSTHRHAISVFWPGPQLPAMSPVAFLLIRLDVVVQAWKAPPPAGHRRAHVMVLPWRTLADQGPRAAAPWVADVERRWLETPDTYLSWWKNVDWTHAHVRRHLLDLRRRWPLARHLRWRWVLEHLVSHLAATAIQHQWRQHRHRQAGPNTC